PCACSAAASTAPPPPCHPARSPSPPPSTPTTPAPATSAQSAPKGSDKPLPAAEIRYDGFSEDYGAGEPGGVGGAVPGGAAALDQAGQGGYCPGAHLVVRQGDGGERRVDAGCDRGLVVEADDREVLGQSEAELLGRAVGAHRHPVVVAEEGGRPVGTIEQF